MTSPEDRVEQWRRTSHLVETALELPAAERRAYLDAACGADAALRSEVEALLLADAETGGRFESPLIVLNTASAREPHPPGRMVGAYQIRRLLGAGGMGEVYLAWDTRLERQVALKMLGHAPSPEILERISREARAAAASEHPHIASVYDVGEADGCIYIAMEYVRGQTLRDMLKAGPLPAKRAIDIILQVAGALEAAHEQGIVHRDVKPENIVIANAGYAKLVDFGLAQGTSERLLASERGVARTTAGGSPAYMAPEQAAGLSIDHRADIFSLGVVLVEAVTGVSPFKRDSLNDTLAAIQSSDAANAAIVKVPPVLRPVAARMLAERRQRFSTIAEAADALRHSADEVRERRVLAFQLRRPMTYAAMLVLFAGLALIQPGWLRRASSTTSPKGIAVFPFSSEAGAAGDAESRWLSTGIQELVITSLGNVPALQVVSAGRLHAASKELGVAPQARITADEARRVARMLGADAWIAGTYSSHDGVRLEIEIGLTASEGRLFRQVLTGPDIFSATEQVLTHLDAPLGVSTSRTRRSLASIVTASADAYQLYAEATEARRNMRLPDARLLLTRAVARDQQFALAHYLLSEIAELEGNMVDMRASLKQAESLKTRLPDRYGRLVEARLAGLEGGSDQAAAILETSMQAFPDEEVYYDALIHIYEGREDVARADALLTRWKDTFPGIRSGHYFNHLGYVRIYQRQFDAALEAFTTYARLAPGEPNPIDSLAEAYLLSGEPSKALTTYERALALQPGFPGSLLGKTWTLGVMGRLGDALRFEQFAAAANAGRFSPQRHALLIGYFHSLLGQDRLADARYAGARRESAARRDQRTHLDVDLVEALIALSRGRHDEALACAMRALESSDKLVQRDSRIQRRMLALALGGIAHARAGRPQEAQQARAEMSTLTEATRYTSWSNGLLGEIFLAAGEFEQADDAFRRSRPQLPVYLLPANSARDLLAHQVPFRDGLARTAMGRGDAARAVIEYDFLIRGGRDVPWISVLDPLLLLSRAEARGAAGDRDGAAADARRFLALWRDAAHDAAERRRATELLRATLVEAAR